MKIAALFHLVFNFLSHPRFILVCANGFVYTIIGVGFWKLELGLIVPGLLLWFELFTEVRNARNS